MAHCGPTSAEQGLKGLRALRCAVIGGSIGGLSAALRLSALGIDVHVYEKAPDGTASGRGAGLGLDLQLLADVLGNAPPPAFVAIRQRVVLDEGAADDSEFGRAHSEKITLEATPYSLLRDALRSSLPDARYHAGKAATGIRSEPSAAVVTFSDGSSVTADLVVCADGYKSACRPLLLGPSPGGGGAPAKYAGYALLRGIVPEEAVPPEVAAAVAATPSLVLSPAGRHHFVAYPVPGPMGETAPGRRRLNWGWCELVVRSRIMRLAQARTHASSVRAHADHAYDQPAADAMGGGAPLSAAQAAEVVSEAGRVWHLKSTAARLVAATAAAPPESGSALSCWPIFEHAPTALVMGRVALLGDAAHVASPITGAGARAAMADALALEAALRDSEAGGPGDCGTKREAPGLDVPRALQAYEASRLRVLRALVESGIRAGAAFRATS